MITWRANWLTGWLSYKVIDELIGWKTGSLTKDQGRTQRTDLQKWLPWCASHICFVGCLHFRHRVKERMPDGMTWYMSDRLSEYMPNRMSELIPDKITDARQNARKHARNYLMPVNWHAVVGITRRKGTLCWFILGQNIRGVYSSASPRLLVHKLLRLFSRLPL